MMEYTQEMLSRRYPTMSVSLAQNLTDLRMCSAGLKDESYRKFYEIAQVVTGLIIYPLTCSLGLTGNALTIFVLSRRNMLTSTNAFLSALAVSDSIKLLNDSMYTLVTILLRTDFDLGKVVYGYLYPYAHFFFSMSVSVSSWLTVSVAVERYILICHPTRARAFWSRRRAILLCVSIYVFMILMSLPSALRYRTFKCVDRKTSLHRVDVELTEIWQNESLVTAYEWIQNLLRSTIPSLLLIVLNVCIISALRRTKSKRKNPRHRVTVMMIVVILVFLICITPDATLSTVFGFGYHEASYLEKAIREITDCLLTINAGVNFIIYCVFNRTFRKSFAQICCFNDRLSGLLTELDVSVYRRLSEAKYLLSTNNNSSPRQATPIKSSLGAAHRENQFSCCPEEGATVVTFDPRTKTSNCHLASTDHRDMRRYSSPLVPSPIGPDNPHQSNHHHHDPHRVPSSAGLKNSQNSVKCNRGKRKSKVTFVDCPEISNNNMDDDSEDEPTFSKYRHEEITNYRSSSQNICCANSESDFVNPCRHLHSNTPPASSTGCVQRSESHPGFISKCLSNTKNTNGKLRFLDGSTVISRAHLSEVTANNLGDRGNYRTFGDIDQDVCEQESIRLTQIRRPPSYGSSRSAATINVDSDVFYNGYHDAPGHADTRRLQETSRDTRREGSSLASTSRRDVFDDSELCVSPYVSPCVSSCDENEILTTDL